MPDDLTTYAENTWCPGCGNFGIFNAFKNAVRRLEQEDGISRNNILITAGIGCHAKISTTWICQVLFPTWQRNSHSPGHETG